MKPFFWWLLGLPALAYVLLCAALWLGQERLLFFPEKLPVGYRFRLPGRWQEYPITAPDGTRLDGLLFQHEGVKPTRGLVFFLHGNGGSLAGWGTLAPIYTRHGYDVFMLDYRGYGKSGGRLGSQRQLLADVEAAYLALAARYPEPTIVVAGYSLGTGPATWLASRHRPRRLLLHAPYASMAALAARTLGWLWTIVPGALLRYPLPTSQWLPRVQAPVWLVHGQRDHLIPPGNSEQLQQQATRARRLLLPASGHNDILQDPGYQRVLPELLGDR